MRIHEIQINHFRCFDNTTIKFNPQFTLLVGNNGAGKSAILDALSVGLGSFFIKLPEHRSGSIKPSDVLNKSFEIGSTIDRQPQYPASVKCTGTFNQMRMEWSRSLTGPSRNTTFGEATTISKQAKELADQVMVGNPSISLPIISYFSTGRVWAKKIEKGSFNAVKSFSRMDGYIDCLDAMTNEKLMHKWFEKMTYQTLQSGQKIPELVAVQKAMVKCFNGGSALGTAVDCSYNVKSGSLEITYLTATGEKEIHPFSELSDGYKNALSIVGDIAYRMAVLNPQFLDDVLEKTNGIVLIDEIELHLHPSWQKRIVSDLTTIFPNVQFIATTHSPSVIGSVKNTSIVILENYVPIYPKESIFGKDVNSTLREVMSVSERQDSVIKLINQFYDQVSHGNLGQARELLLDMKHTLGVHDSEVINAEITLKLETME